MRTFVSELDVLGRYKWLHTKVNWVLITYVCLRYFFGSKVSIWRQLIELSSNRYDKWQATHNERGLFIGLGKSAADNAVSNLIWGMRLTTLKSRTYVRIKCKAFCTIYTGYVFGTKTIQNCPMCYNSISITDKYAFWPILFIFLKHSQDTQPCKTAQIQTDLYKKLVI